MPEEKIPTLEEITKYVQSEEKKGHICLAVEDYCDSYSLSEFLDQPIEGLLYDLDLLPEQVLSCCRSNRRLIWEYALYLTIKELKEKYDSFHSLDVRKELSDECKICDIMPGECWNCKYSNK